MALSLNFCINGAPPPPTSQVLLYVYCILPLTADTYITAYYKHTQINFIQVIRKGRSCVPLKESWA